MHDPICSCSCGQSIPRKHLFRYKEPYLLRGHVPQEAIICECGCGEPIPWKDHYRTARPHRLPGHRSLAERAKDAARRKPEMNPGGLCLCGCGKAAPRDRQGRSYRYISGHNSNGMKRGEGRYVNRFGYVMLRLPNHPDAQGGYVREHRWVMEQTLGRPLLRAEHVHHVNGDKTDNRPENLMLVDRVEHGRLHGRPRGAATSPEHRAKLSAQMKRVWAERRPA